MPKTVRVNLQDKFRTLLTDVLPYELPVWFHNYNFYQLLKSDKFYSYQKIHGLKENCKIFIPLSYRISRGANKSPREISIMHPFAQISVCDFYSEYNEIIEFYCSRSKQSLRYPYRIARAVYDKSEFESKSDIKLDVDGHESVVASSYFKYRKYAFLYKFFESYEYHQLEKRFQFMLQVDISKCFPSIYTHSIAWATKSKRFAKQNIQSSRGSFDQEFDSLMQTTNYRETNGIIIGPEVSRIFAEIILQRIDLDTIELMEKRGLILGDDYQFKRYVDDYFVFYNEPNKQLAFVKCLEEALLSYKLYLNEAKTQDFQRPFTTPITLAKSRLKEEVESIYESRFTSCIKDGKEHRTLKKCKFPNREANKIIQRLKLCFSEYSVSYLSISNYVISSLEKKISKQISQLENLDLDEADNPLDYIGWVLVDIDVLFFIHAMDIRVRPTDLVARCVVGLIDKIEGVEFFNANYVELIYQKTFDQVRQAIDIVSHNSKHINGVETLNLLLILTKLPEQYLLPIESLRKYFNSLVSNGYDDKGKLMDGGYFLWVTFMLYIKNNAEYEDFKIELVELAKQFLINHRDFFISTEFFLLFFDFLSCPYVDVKIKDEVARIIKKETGNEFSISKLKNDIYQKDFIVSWGDTDLLRNSLRKKQFTFPYK